MLCLALLPRHKVQKLDSQSEFSLSKMIRIFLIFFQLKNKSLEAHFLLKMIFGNFNFKTTILLKSGLIFDKAAKLEAKPPGMANFVRPFEKLVCRRYRF